MKKFVMTALAAGALSIGGAASAQSFSQFVDSLFGLNQPSYSYSQPQPAVVGQTYTDQYGRRFYYDQYGRQVYLQSGQQIIGYDSWGRPIYGTQSTQQVIIGYDSWGRPIYGNASTYGSSSTYGSNTYGSRSYWDRDGDGVANSRDRWPDDPRYW